LWNSTVVKCKSEGRGGGVYSWGRLCGIGKGGHALGKDRRRMYIGGIGWVGIVRGILHMAVIILILAKERRRI
jgi:hypothetical protein